MYVILDLLPHDDMRDILVELVEPSSSTQIDDATEFIHASIVESRQKYLKKDVRTVKPVYNDHLMGYFSAFWSSYRWSMAT